MSDFALDIQIWRGSRDPIDQVTGVLASSHGRPVDEEWLTQKMCRPESPAVAALAMSEGAAVGIVAFGLNSYLLGGRVVTAGLSYDTFVAESMRGQGLFMRLLAVAEQAAADEGADLLLNFPNHNSRRGFEKAGWTALEPCRPYVHPTRRWALGLPASATRLFDARRSYLVPDASMSLTADDAARFADRLQPDRRFQMRMEQSDVAERFSLRRGVGYCYISGKGGADAIARLGTRGSLRELQLLAMAPRIPSAAQVRNLLRTARRQYDVDVVSYLATSRPGTGALLQSAGFVRLPANTTPYVKPFRSDVAIGDYIISGVDIHTW